MKFSHYLIFFFNFEVLMIIFETISRKIINFFETYSQFSTKKDGTFFAYRTFLVMFRHVTLDNLVVSFF